MRAQHNFVKSFVFRYEISKQSRCLDFKNKKLQKYKLYLRRKNGKTCI